MDFDVLQKLAVIADPIIAMRTFERKTVARLMELLVMNEILAALGRVRALLAVKRVDLPRFDVSGSDGIIGSGLGSSGSDGGIGRRRHTW